MRTSDGSLLQEQKKKTNFPFSFVGLTDKKTYLFCFCGTKTKQIRLLVSQTHEWKRKTRSTRLMKKANKSRQFETSLLHFSILVLSSINVSLLIWHLVAFRPYSTALRHVDQAPEMHKICNVSPWENAQRTLTFILNHLKSARMNAVIGESR